LSPEDEWAGAITVNPNGDGAIIRTVDNSCTVPELGTEGGFNVGEFAGTQTEQADGSIRRDQPFVNFNYLEDEDTSVARTLEGYVEVIEMGQLDPETFLGADAVHDENGVPADCDALVAAWSRDTDGNNGAWLDSSGGAQLLTWTGGGLYGYGVVINVADGTAIGYDATAIDAFNDGSGGLHFEPGLESPSLADAQIGVTLFEGDAANPYDMKNGADATSALFMAQDLANDYVIDPDINALTDWVITMPTKRFYANNGFVTTAAPGAAIGDALAATPPFNAGWDRTNACEPVSIEQWDREEAFVPPPSQSDGPEFSPQPPFVPDDLVDFNLCTEVSVVTFGGQDSALNVTESIQYGFEPSYSEGWARMSFLADSVNGELQLGARELADVSDVTAFLGLPVVGFAVFNYQNGNLGDGVLANYAAASEHKTRTSSSAPTPAPAPAPVP
jgi:hypothetical protein